MAFAIYGSSQLFCVVWQVMLFASFAVITYAYLRIEDKSLIASCTTKCVITYAYLRIEEPYKLYTQVSVPVITYAYLQIEDFTLLCLFSATKL